MTITTIAACTAESTTIGYLLQALAAAGTYDHFPAIGMPPSTVRVDDRGVILSVTPRPLDLYRDWARDLAVALTSDVVLLRLEQIEDALIHVAADLTLGLLPGKPLSLPDHALWASPDGELWLVPQAYGPVVSVDPSGLTLELITPYETLQQRSAGLLRAAGALAQIYRTAAVR